MSRAESSCLYPAEKLRSETVDTRDGAYSVASVCGERGLRALAVDDSGRILENRARAQGPGSDGHRFEGERLELPERTFCVAFIPPEGTLNGVQELVAAFKKDARMAVAGLRRTDREGKTLASVCLRPTWSDLLCRHLISSSSRRGVLGPGLPIAGFAHDRTLAVEVVHPEAWAVRAAHWADLEGVSGELSWEYGVQDFVDRLARRGLEAFFVPETCVTGVDRVRDCWCRPPRNLAALRGLFRYVRRRWGPWRVRLFRWVFKPLFLLRLCLELPVRLVLLSRGSKACRDRALDGPGAIARFLVFQAPAFLRIR